MPPVDHAQLLHLRLRRQLIAPHAPLSPAEVVRRLGAMQAQDLLGAKWALALRTSSALGEADIDAAIAEKQVVRSWPMRGTLHFVAPGDLRWMLSVTTEKLIAGAARRREALGLTDEQLARAREAAVEALSGGRALERKEMLAAFERAGVATEKQRGYHILWNLAQTGLLCFGPMKGRQPTFVLLDEWVGPSEIPPRAESIARFAKRYFEGHGPATERDFARWTGLTLTEARQGMRALGDELASFVTGGVEYWAPTEALQQAEADTAQLSEGVYLLPGFDEYVVGYGDREQMFGDYHLEYHGRVAANGMFAPVIVSRGSVVGVWSRALKAREVVVEAKLFGALSPAEKSLLAEQVERYGVYLGKPARLAD